MPGFSAERCVYYRGGVQQDRASAPRRQKQRMMSRHSQGAIANKTREDSDFVGETVTFTKNNRIKLCKLHNKVSGTTLRRLPCSNLVFRKFRKN